MFTTEMIQTRVRKQPFVPLRIVTSSGEAYEVRHPDLIMVGAREITVGLPHEKKPAVYKDQARISLLHIAALEELAVSKSSKGNGKK